VAIELAQKTADSADVHACNQREEVAVASRMPDAGLPLRLCSTSHLRPLSVAATHLSSIYPKTIEEMLATFSF
jgi:hypothetical protein